MADMHSDDLAKAEVSINTEANSGKAVELPRHNYFTANGYHTFLLTTPGSGNNELILSMANKVYKVPVALFFNFTLLEYLNILAAGIGGVNILHAQGVGGEAITGLTRLSSVSCGGEVYQARKYLDAGYQALHTNVLNLITAGVNIHDLEASASSLSRMQVITSEIAALTDILASVSKIGDPTPMTHVVQYLISQMFDCQISVADGIVTVDYSYGSRAWNAQPYAAHIDPVILLICAEDVWYKTQSGARTSASRFLSDDALTGVIINFDGHQIARYDKEEGDVSVADIYRRTITEQTSESMIQAIANDVPDLVPLVDTLDSNCFYPVDIPTAEQGADSNMIGRGQGSCDPFKDTMVRYDAKSTIVLPKLGDHKDSYPQLAANHLALEGMLFAHAEGAADRTSIMTQTPALTATAVYGQWKAALRGADDKTSEAHYTLTPNTSPDVHLDTEFEKGAFYHSVLESCAGELFTKDHVGTLDAPAIIMGSCCAQDTQGCGRVQLGDGSQLTLRPSASNVFLKYGTNVLDHAPEVIPDGFGPLPLSGTDETEHRCSPIYANLEAFLVDFVLTDANGKVVTQGTFNLKSWPRLAIQDIRDYQKLLTAQIKTASSDQAGGDAQNEDGSQIPRNWFEDLLSWFKDIFKSKWLWIIIAIVVVIILTRNSGGSGSSTVIIMKNDATPSTNRINSNPVENTQSQPSSSQANSPDLDLI
jgi:hypothetical protein